MSWKEQYRWNRQYLETRIGRGVRRVVDDDRGAATAEHIIMVGAAVVGAAIVGTILWTKMQEGANNVQTPAP